LLNLLEVYDFHPSAKLDDANIVSLLLGEGAGGSGSRGSSDDERHYLCVSYINSMHPRFLISIHVCMLPFDFAYVG
jgi:hypothetical protein